MSFLNLQGCSRGCDSCHSSVQEGAMSDGVRVQQQQAPIVGTGPSARVLKFDQLQRLRDQSPATLARLQKGEPLNLADIQALNELQVGDQAIMGHIECTDCLFILTPTDIVNLKKAGVSSEVINEMIQTARRPGSEPKP